MFRPLLLVSLLSLVSLPAFAEDCKVTVESTDQMTYNTDAITVSPSCTTFTVELKHVGTLSRDVMGHNWVLTRKADERGAAMDGMFAGKANGYVKPGDKRVIAATKLIGGGESTSVTFDVAALKAGENYTFFCSFPGHVTAMRGTLRLGD